MVTATNMAVLPARTPSGVPPTGTPCAWHMLKADRGLRAGVVTRYTSETARFLMTQRQPTGGPKGGRPAPPGPLDLFVLVLDDEESIRKGLCRFLQSQGYGAIEAASFDEAVSALQTRPVGAVILDVRLPGAHSGLDVLAQLRDVAACRDIPAIVLTGGTLNETEERSVAKHRAHLFYKPEGFSALVDFLKQLTGHDQPH